MTREDRKALFDNQTDRVGIDLVEISSDSIDTLYLCRNTESIISRGNTYLPAGMKIGKPEKGSSVSQGTLQLSGINQDHLQIIQELSPDAVVEVMNVFIFADAPDDYVDGPYNYVVEGANINSATGTMEISLVVESPMEYYASQRRYEPKGCPAIWT